jgi:hypothetical protein
MCIHDPGLDHRKPVGFVYSQDLAHAGEFNDNAAIKGQGAARQSRAGSARSKRHSGLTEDSHHGGGFFRSRRKNHSAGQIFVVREAVTLVNK